MQEFLLTKILGQHNLAERMASTYLQAYENLETIPEQTLDELWMQSQMAAKVSLLNSIL